MELNEMEKRMLYQTEGSDRYAILHELAMVSRYAGNPDRRKAADSLIGKLNSLPDSGCMEIVHGVNQVSRNILFGNRKRLVNGNGFIFGVPGSGKSFFAKMEMGNVFLNTDDDIIVIDPQHEYFGIAERFGGQVIVLSTYTGNYINPMALPEDVSDIQGIIAEKGEFMLGICEQCMGEALNSRQKSIIDRCVRLLYQEIKEECMRNRGKQEGEKTKTLWKQKTLHDYYDILVSQPEMEAKELALSLELFIGGSLNIFAHETNVDIDNRFLVYGIRDMGKELSAISMLVMMENIGNRIMENAQAGDTITVLRDCRVSATLEVTADNITLKSEDAGNPATISREEDFAGKSYGMNTDTVLLAVTGGSLITQDIVFDGGAVLDGDFNNSGKIWNSPLIYVDGSYAMEGGTVLQNNYNTDGDDGSSGGRTLHTAGALHIVKGGSLTMSGGLIQNCYTAGAGGGIQSGQDSQVTATSGIIRNCYATWGGGADLRGSAELSNMTFTGNEAGSSGGGISSSASLTVTDCLVEGNRSAYDGGGIYTGTGHLAHITGCTITGNMAGRGSAIQTGKGEGEL